MIYKLDWIMFSFLLSIILNIKFPLDLSIVSYLWIFLSWNSLCQVLFLGGSFTHLIFICVLYPAFKL